MRVHAARDWCTRAPEWVHAGTVRHAVALTTCRLRSVLQGCPARIQAKHAHAHRTNLCPKRLVVCSNPNCWKKLMADNRQQHEVFECRYSKQWCPIGCKKYILRFELQSHIDNRCPERQVECRCAVWRGVYRALSQVRALLGRAMEAHATQHDAPTCPATGTATSW